MSWRDNLRPASFRGAEFHVETRSSGGGRRLVNTEYPKRDTNSIEDMGRRGRRFSVEAYLIGEDYDVERDALIEAMEAEGQGLLVLPTDAADRLVEPDTYTCTEARERGGYCAIELSFFESPDDTALQAPGQDTSGGVTIAAKQAGATAATSLDGGLLSI